MRAESDAGVDLTRALWAVPVAPHLLTQNVRKETVMMKTFEAMSDAVRNPKYLFRKNENQPKKPQKHRYERRKIKAYLQLADWQTEAVG